MLSVLNFTAMSGASMSKKPLVTLLEDTLRQKIQHCVVESDYMTLGKPLGKGKLTLCTPIRLLFNSENMEINNLER